MRPAGEIEAEQHDAAILFADVKGYSVLLRQDEVGTYARLQRARALFRQLAAVYGGTIVDEAGDGVLAAFETSGRAIDFALAAQHDLAPLGHAGHELAHALLRRPRRHALLVAARRAVHEARLPEPVEVENDVRRERVHEGGPLRPVLRREPGAALALVAAEHPVGVAAHEERASSSKRIERLDRHRAGGDVAADDDGVDAHRVDIRKHRLERRQVGRTHDRDAAGGMGQRRGRRERARRHLVQLAAGAAQRGCEGLVGPLGVPERLDGRDARRERGGYEILALDGFVTERIGIEDVEPAFERMTAGKVLRSVVELDR